MGRNVRMKQVLDTTLDNFGQFVLNLHEQEGVGSAASNRGACGASPGELP